jgi:hypothetical protein
MHWLRVPPEPQPPRGAPGSVRQFRSGHNALRLSLTLWAIKQGVALMGLLVGLAMVAEFRSLHRASQAPNGGEPVGTVRSLLRTLPPLKYLRDLAPKTPEPIFWVLYLAEAASVVTYLVQIPLTYALRRLDYEQRWYIVTDRSLRLRSGVWTVREVTMSFANLQQITVTQDPLQRLLGLSDVRVQSAGGGASSPQDSSAGHEPSHLGFFRAVDNAEEIRNLILDRLRQFRESGLGDPDEPTPNAPAPSVAHPPDTLLDATRDLLTEARALRETLVRRRERT